MHICELQRRSVKMNFNSALAVAGIRSGFPQMLNVATQTFDLLFLQDTFVFQMSNALLIFLPRTL
jgi:hypothetical protein